MAAPSSTSGKRPDAASGKSVQLTRGRKPPRSRAPKSNRAVLQHNLDWFSHYIWGETLAADSPLRGRGEAAP